MDLTLSEPYRALQAEIRAFIREHGDKSPKVGGGRKRPDQKTLDWPPWPNALPHSNRAAR